MLPMTEDNLSLLAKHNMSSPITLESANLTKSFVYDRKFGFFYVAGGSHNIAMSFLYAMHHGFNDIHKMFEHPDFSNMKGRGSICLGEISDRYISEIEGVCFKSSVSNYILGGSPSHINRREMTFFEGRIQFLES